MKKLIKHKKPKIGDIVICIDDGSQDEDFGMSGIVLKGTKGLIVGKEYTITSVDISQIPKRTNSNGYSYWTLEEYEDIKWCWTMCGIEGNGFHHPRMCLGNIFKRKIVN